MTFGVTPAGFTPKTIEDVIADVTADLRGPEGIDPAIDLSPTQPLGQIIGALAKPVAETWEVAQAVSNTTNPNGAEGTILENVCSITGTTRAGATKGVVLGVLTLGSSKTVPAGSIIAVAGQPGNRWVLIGPSNVGYARIPGDVVSTTAGAYYGLFESETTGPNQANAGTATTIVTPVSGWTAVTNPADARAGSAVETDTHLRQKRRAELAVAGGGTLDAMRGDLLELVGMVDAKIYENTLRTAYDSDGRPPGGVEAVIFDGVVPAVADADIARVVWTNKPAGNPLMGRTTSATYTDATGTVRAVPFTRVTIVQVAIAISVQVDSSTFPSDGVAQIKAALAAKGLASIRVGGTIYPLTYQAAVSSAVAGIANITSYLHGRLIGTGATLTTPLTSTTREMFFVDTANITVTVVP